MRPYLIEVRTRKYVKEYGYEKQLLDKGIDSLKTNSKNVVHKAGKVLGNKPVDAVTKSNDDKIVNPHENSGNVEQIIIPPEKRDEILNKWRKEVSKWNTRKYLSY